MLLLNCGFPQAKTLHAELNVHFTSFRQMRALAAARLFRGPGSERFRLRNHAGAQKRVTRAHVRVRSGHKRTWRDPKAARGFPNPRFGCLWATRLAPICERGDIERTLLLIMF